MSYLGYYDSVLSDQGQPIVATITIYLAGTDTKATIYSNPGGTLKDNPFQTDVLGRFQFFASDGQYDIDVSGSGITSYKIQYVYIFSGTVETWQTPTLLNGWVNFGSGYNPAGYYKDAMGVVHLRGMLKNGTIGQAMFILSAGYRPAYLELFSANSNASAAYLNVAADGQVVPVNGSNVFFSLDGMTFHAA